MTFRAASAGTGAVAHLHAQAVIADPRVDLVAVSYRSAARRDAFADQYDVAGRYATITELLAGEQLDVVILCTPPDLHLEQALTAYGAGVHVICEKPPALSLAELDEMQAAAAGLVLAVVFQQSTGSAAAHVRNLLDTGAFGRPLLAQCQTLWLRQDGYYAADWRGTWDGEGGGTTLGHGIHQMDLLAHLPGDWAEVDARLWRLARDIEMEDVSTATIRFANGVVAVAVSSVLSPRETSYVRIDTELATVEVEHLYGHSGDSWCITPGPPDHPRESPRRSVVPCVPARRRGGPSAESLTYSSQVCRRPHMPYRRGPGRAVALATAALAKCGARPPARSTSACAVATDRSGTSADQISCQLATLSATRWPAAA